MEIRYRAAEHRDEEQLFALAANLATSYKLTRSDFSVSFRDLVSGKDCDLWVAEHDSGLIGYVLGFHHAAFYANGVVSWVEELYVRDDFRSMHIGKKLMALLEERAVERGSKLAALATRRAGDFYKAIGYEESAVYFKKRLDRN